jgi:hypothetical protein
MVCWRYGMFLPIPILNDYTPTKWFLHGFCMGYKTIDDNAKHGQF